MWRPNGTAVTLALASSLIVVLAVGCKPSDKLNKRLEKTLKKEQSKAEEAAAQAAAEAEREKARLAAEARAKEEASKVPAASGAIGVGEKLQPFFNTEALSEDAALRSEIEKLARARPSKKLLAMLTAKKALAGPALARALWHENANVRSQSGALLAHVKAKGAEVDDAFRRSLRTEPDRDVRAMVAKALVTHQLKSMVPLLIEVLAKDGEHQVRANAAYALGAIGDRQAVDPLIAALAHKETWVRLRSVTALRRLKARKAVPALEHMLSDQNVLVRQDTVRALKTITGKKYAERSPRLVQ